MTHNTQPAKSTGTRFASRMASALTLALALSAATFASAADTQELAPWSPATPEQLRAECDNWLDSAQAAQGLRDKVLALWPTGESDAPSGPELLDRIVDTAALLDAQADRLRNNCSQSASSHIAPDHAWLAEGDLPETMRNNLRLYFARWLAHEQFYDETLTTLEGLSPDDVADPGTLLFFRAVAYHRLLKKREGLAAIGELLAAKSQCPARYVAIAELMKEELEALEDESLDHIARRMEDVERRLDKGRANQRVRDIEDGIIDSLDTMIKKLEEQQQQSSASANSIQSSNPAQDSNLMGGKGRGDVDSKPIGSKDGWGDLPEKEREKVMQEISREFPSHYSEVIEQYFRQMAGDENQP